MSHEIEIIRDFAAPRELVFENWTHADHVRAWFAPDGWEVTECVFVARPGAEWRVAYRAGNGRTFVEYGRIEEVVAPERLVFTLVQDDRSVGPETRVTVTFASDGDRTRMTFRQTGFDTEARRSGNAEGWASCFAKLELVALFSEWFHAAAARDLDRSMASIAEDALSYEHGVPLQYRGVAAIREVCRQGFELAKGDFAWTVPDLQILVRDDVAVAWGLNRMESREPGKPAAVMWSRGTRVFRRIDGAWKMIHQHVSFPFDPATGMVATAIAP